MSSRKFGRYEIKSELGRGGMATVYHAFDPRFKRDVALKVLPREFLHDPTFRTRFEREAQTIATFEHPAIVPVYDFGEDNGQPYLVMRLLSGGTLTERLEHYGALPLQDVIRIIDRLAPALDEAHAQGIVHRDLKPDNILFDQRNAPYITDFGVVKLSDGGTITTQNVIVGTPAYMSPEQAQGDAVIDGRSDIYALGVILFQMLSGQLPYQATTPVGLVMKHITEPVPHILEINPNLPPVCDSVIKYALAKKPNQRFSTAGTLAAALNGSGHLPDHTPGTAGIVPIPIPVGDAAGPEQKTNDELDAASSPKRLKALQCPNCTASLPGNFTPGQPLECNNCGSRFLVTMPEVDESITCPACQTVNPNTLRYCASCGEKIKIDCVRCHTANPVDVTHCANCGTNLQSAEQRRRELQENRRRTQEERDQMLKQKKARQLKEKIARLIDELDTPARQEFAIYQLNQIGDPAVNALVNTLLDDANLNARLGAAKALAEISAGYTIKTLSKARIAKGFIKALADPEPAIRYHSANALGTFQGKQAELAVEPLGKLLKDKHEEVRKQARASLEKIGGPRVQEILESSKGFMGWLR